MYRIVTVCGSTLYVHVLCVHVHVGIMINRKTYTLASSPKKEVLRQHKSVSLETRGTCTCSLPHTLHFLIRVPMKNSLNRRGHFILEREKFRYPVGGASIRGALNN